jgi:hypothetical protein
MCLCGCEKGQTLFERIQSRLQHVHHSGWSMSGHTHSPPDHNHSIAVPDIEGTLKNLCDEIENEQKLVEEELLKMKGHIRRLVNYLMDQDGIVGREKFRELINDEARNLLLEAKDEIIKLRAQAGFLSEDDMKLK